MRANNILLDRLKQVCTCKYHKGRNGKKYITTQCIRHKIQNKF